MNNENLFHGFKCEKIDFDGTFGYVVFPDSKPNGKTVLKTEYWDAFPELEIQLLSRGFHLIHLKNYTRLANKHDCSRKAEFVKYVSEKYGLDCRCILVGMSCGGAQAINFARYYPELVSCLVIDAPVVNFLDFPGKYNKYEKTWDSEFKIAYPGVKRPDVFKLDENPVNGIYKLIEEKFPVIMLYGTEDTTVDYDSNGRYIEEAYSDNQDLITIIPRKHQGHHPHGLLDKSNELADIVVSKI